MRDTLNADEGLVLVRSLGADRVIDYTREDFTKGTQRYDLIVDTVATHSLLEYKRALTPTGTYVMVGMVNPGNWFAWLAKPIGGMILSPFGRQKLGMMIADLNGNDLTSLGALMQSGKLTPVIDRTYKLGEASGRAALPREGPRPRQGCPHG